MADDATQQTQPAAKKAATKRTPKAPTADQLREHVRQALADPEHPAHAEVREQVETLAAEQKPTGEPRNVIEAILAVMRTVRAVGKNGQNEDQGYRFRGIDDTVNALGPAMRDHGLIVSPVATTTTYERIEVGRNRSLGGRAEVHVTYRFHHSDANGDITTLDAQVPGESIDYGDKATAKAMSVAYRIALLQTFTLPTHEPDPDQRSYEDVTPAQVTPPLTKQEVVDAASWASGQDDVPAAFEHVRERLGLERLAALAMLTKDRQELPGDQWLSYAERLTMEQRAADERAQQDQDAQGESPRAQESEKAPEPARTEDAPAQDARTEAPAERAPEPQPDAQQQEQTRAHEQQQRAKSAPRESGPEKIKRLSLEELAFQAEVLGQNFLDYAAPALNVSGDAESLHMNRARVFLVEQRGAVIEALRARGDASVAERYAAIGMGFPLVLDKVLDESEGQRAPQGARQ